MNNIYLQCDDSLSSGSLGGRSLSPTRSDELSDTPRHPLMVKVLPSRPVRKRRLAPKPPSVRPTQIKFYPNNAFLIKKNFLATTKFP